MTEGSLQVLTLQLLQRVNTSFQSRQECQYQILHQKWAKQEDLIQPKIFLTVPLSCCYLDGQAGGRCSLTWRQELSAAVGESAECGQMKWKHTMNPSSGEKSSKNMLILSMSKDNRSSTKVLFKCASPWLWTAAAGGSAPFLTWLCRRRWWSGC